MLNNLFLSIVTLVLYAMHQENPKLTRSPELAITSTFFIYSSAFINVTKMTFHSELKAHKNLF